MHTRINHILAASVATTLIGCILFLFHQEIVVIKFGVGTSLNTSSNMVLQKKLVRLFFWRNEKWESEECELLWPDDKTDALQIMITRWLVVLEEENIIQKKVGVQLTSITTNNQALVSLDRNPFNKEQSTFEKLLLIEGLLKTIRESGIKIQALQFLVDHKPLQDYHLDFSRAWPISGFVEK